MLGNNPSQLPLGNSGAIGSKPITSSKEPLLASGELKDALGGTPKVPKKMAGPLARRGTSGSRVIEKEMILPT